jgi:phosphoenolpyruvate synthase/pyruvate phosphate dikinase
LRSPVLEAPVKQGVDSISLNPDTALTTTLTIAAAESR